MLKREKIRHIVQQLHSRCLLYKVNQTRMYWMITGWEWCKILSIGARTH